MNMHLNRSAARAMALFALVAVMAFSALAAARAADGGFVKQGEGGGGFSGPGPKVTTVKQALDMRDDAKVVLQGKIVEHLGGEDYLFQDSTGTVTVEIDQKRWQGQAVTPNDTVEIYGEVDRDWSKVEIDVKRIIKK